MLIKIRVGLVGDGYSLKPGDVVDLDEIKKCEPGAAAWLTEPEGDPRAEELTGEAPRTAVVTPPQRAIKPKGEPVEGPRWKK